MKNYRTLGTLSGYTGTKDVIDDTTVPNNWGGAYPGQPQPAGTAFIGHREGGSSDQWNRALGALGENLDIIRGMFTSAQIAGFGFDSAWFSGLGAGVGLNQQPHGATQIDLEAFNAGESPLFMYVGVSSPADHNRGAPFFLYYSDITHPKNLHTIPDVVTDVQYGGNSMWSTAGVGSDIGLVDDLPLEVTTGGAGSPLCLMNSITYGVATDIFDVDGIRMVGGWYGMGAVPGSFIKVTGAKNPGWYQITEITANDTKAILTRSAAKRITMDPLDVVALAGAGMDFGWRLEVLNSGRFFYVMDYDVVTGEIWLHPWLGSPVLDQTTAAQLHKANDVTDIGAATVLHLSADILVGATFGTVLTVDEMGEDLIFDIGDTSTTSVYSYAPPGFLPIGWNAVAATTAHLIIAGGLTALPSSPVDLGMGFGVMDMAGDYMTSSYSVGGRTTNYAPTNQESSLPYRTSQDLHRVTEAGPNNDTKVRTVAHPSDSGDAQQWVADSTAALTAGFDETGSVLYGNVISADPNAQAPYEYFRTENGNLMAQLSQLQAINFSCNTPRLLFADTLGFAAPAPANSVVWNTLTFTVAGLFTEIPAGSIRPGPGWGGAPATWFVFYDTALEVVAVDTALPTRRDLPGGVNDYPVAGFVLLAIVHANDIGPDQANYVTGAREFQNLEHMLPLVVGNTGDANFGTLEEAFHFMNTTWNDLKISFPAEIQLTGNLTGATGTITVASGIKNVRIVGKNTTGTNCVFMQALDEPMFAFGGDADLSITFENVEFSWISALGGVEPFISIESFMDELVFRNCTFTHTGTSCPSFIRFNVVAGLSLGSLIMEGCAFEADNIVDMSGAQPYDVTHFYVDGCEFTAAGGPGSGIAFDIQGTPTINPMVVLANSKFDGWVTGVSVISAADYKFRNLLFENCTDIHMNIFGSGQVEIEGCDFYASSFSPAVSPSGVVTVASAHGIVSKCRFFDVPEGYSVNATGNGVHVLNCQVDLTGLAFVADTDYEGQIRLDGNYCVADGCQMEAGTARFGSLGAYLLDGAYCTLRGSRLYDWGSVAQKTDTDGSFLGAPVEFSSPGTPIAGTDAAKYLHVFDTVGLANTGVFLITSVSGTPAAQSTHATWVAGDGRNGNISWGIRNAVGVMVQGNHATIENCEFEGIGDSGLPEEMGIGIMYPLDGSSMSTLTIQDNRFGSMGQGVFLGEGVAAKVKGNTFRSTSLYRALCTYDVGIQLENNLVIETQGDSFVLQAVGATHADMCHVTGNKVITYANSATYLQQAAFRIDAPRTVISGNSALNEGNASNALHESGGEAIVVGNQFGNNGYLIHVTIMPPTGAATTVQIEHVNTDL